MIPGKSQLWFGVRREVHSKENWYLMNQCLRWASVCLSSWKDRREISEGPVQFWTPSSSKRKLSFFCVKTKDWNRVHRSIAGLLWDVSVLMPGRVISTGKFWDCTTRNKKWMLACTDQVGASTGHVPTNLSQVITKWLTNNSRYIDTSPHYLQDWIL